MSEVTMPRLSDSMEEGTIVRWLKPDGDEVKRGEEIVEIETDKAIMPYEADTSGQLNIAALEGATVPVGAVIGYIGEGASTSLHGGEVADATPASSARRDLRSGSAITFVSRPIPPAMAAADAVAKASPLARRIAQALGVDVRSVSGSGPHGRVLKSDVVAAARSHRVASAASTQASLGAGDRVQEMSRTQVLIARRMAESRRDIPDFALEVDVDMSRVLALRAELKAITDPVPTLNDVIVKACARVLRNHPRANGSYADGQFIVRADVNVAIAVATEGSLVVPVIREADVKSLGTIADESRALIARVRDRSISPDQLEGGTFTVSNLGMLGIDRFEGIINAPQAAILCVGAVRDRPVALAGEVAVRPVTSLTLVSDHRIMYGADAAAFLNELRMVLHEPLRALV